MGVRPVFETPYERGGVVTPGLPILPHGEPIAELF